MLAIETYVKIHNAHLQMSEETLKHRWTCSQEIYTTDVDLHFYEILAPLVALFKYVDNVLLQFYMKAFIV